MTKRQHESLLKKIKAVEARLSDDRDTIRELIDQLEGLDDSASRALDSLTEAADALSELV